MLLLRFQVEVEEGRLISDCLHDSMRYVMVNKVVEERTSNLYP